MSLQWNIFGGHEEAMLGDSSDGVSFTLTYHPTCYRRGPWRLLVEVVGGNHVAWGCFDDQDQPMRYYHRKECAVAEAGAIADVLLSDRAKKNIPLQTNE